MLDTDVLLSMRVLKRTEGTAADQADLWLQAAPPGGQVHPQRHPVLTMALETKTLSDLAGLKGESGEAVCHDTSGEVTFARRLEISAR